MLTREDVQTLTAPFTASEHEFHRGFVYITESGITNRIEQVDPSWELKTNWIIQRDNFNTAHVTLTICGVSRDGIGMATQEYTKDGAKPIGEPEKSAATDAMKRAARLFGIGRYLLDAPKDMNETTLRKWLNTLRTPVADTIPRPAEPARSELAEDDASYGKLTHITRALDKNNKVYYRFNGGVFTYSRDPFRLAGVTECETWGDLPQDTTLELPAGIFAHVKQVANGRYQVDKVEVKS